MICSREVSVAFTAILLSGCNGEGNLDLQQTARGEPVPEKAQFREPVLIPRVPVSAEFYEELGRGFAGMKECRLIVDIPAHSPFAGISDRVQTSITEFLGKQGVEVLSAARSAELEKSGIVPPILQYEQTVSDLNASGVRGFQEMYSVTDFVIAAHDPNRVHREFTMLFSNFGYVDLGNSRVVSRLVSEMERDVLGPLESCFRNLAAYPVQRERFHLDPKVFLPTASQEWLRAAQQNVFSSLVGIDRVFLVVAMRDRQFSGEQTQAQRYRFRGLETEAQTLVRRKLKELGIAVVDEEALVKGWEETGLPVHDMGVQLSVDDGDNGDGFVGGSVKISLCGPAILQRDPTHVFRGHRYMYSVVCGDREGRFAAMMSNSLGVGLEDFAGHYLRAKRWAEAKRPLNTPQ
jgi:hypothetical protein